jgi:hypothetical protein
MAGDGTPVRAQNTRDNGSEYNIYNPNGYGTAATGPYVNSIIRSAILCNDYPTGDDCSPRLY